MATNTPSETPLNSTKIGALGARGQRFMDKALAGFKLEDSEVELLTEVCRGLDLLDLFQQELEASGLTVTAANGAVRVHPFVAEKRQTALAVARLLAQLALPDEEGIESVQKLTSARASKASRARWTNHG